MSNEVYPCFSLNGLLGKPEVNADVDLVLKDICEAEKEDEGVEMPLGFDKEIGARELGIQGIECVSSNHIQEADYHYSRDKVHSDLAKEVADFFDKADDCSHVGFLRLIDCFSP